MPSLLDQLHGGTDADVPPPSPPPGLLDVVKVDGGRRRANRRRRNLALAVLCLALLAVPAATLRAGGDGRDRGVDIAAGDDETTTTFEAVDSLPVVDPLPAPPESTVAPPVAAPITEPVTTVPPTTVAPTTAPPKPPPTTTATTARVCRNSTDPACGPWRWDPPPGPNQPLRASFTKAPTTAVAGQQVTFEVVWSDPDARLHSERFSTDGTSIGTACTLVAKYGPWTPPAPAAGSGTLSYPTSFATPGTYTVAVDIATGDPKGPVDDSCLVPYGSGTRLQSTITVTAGPA